MPSLLNIGAGPVPPPEQYHGWEIVTLDIDESVQPDIVLDARELTTLEPGQYDAVYASHVLEHFAECDVERVLWGFYHILKPRGWAHIRVPDVKEVLEAVVENKLDLDDTLYTAQVGAIRVCDVLWGWQAQIKRSEQPHYSHRYGFSGSVLGRAIKRAHFEYVELGYGGFEITAMAYKRRPGEAE